MGESELLQSIRRNEAVVRLVGQLIVSLMLVCVVISVVQVGHRLFPAWDGGFLVWVTFLISLEAMYLRSLIAKRRVYFPSGEWFLYRGTEWIVLLVALKLVLYLVHGFEQLSSDIPLWEESFLPHFFSGEYIFVCFIALMVWSLSSIFHDELTYLQGDETLLALDRDASISIARGEARKHLVNLILLIGGVMVLLTALVRKDVQIMWGDSPVSRASVYNVLAYFLLALVLLSLTQFSILRARWSLNRIQVGRDLAVNWALYSFLFLLALVVVAALLPTHYSLNLLYLLNILIHLVFALAGILLLILSIPIFALLYLVSLLMGKPPPEAPELAIPPISIAPPAAGAPVDWWEALKSLIFWVFFLGIIGYALFYYLKIHQDNLQKLRRFPLIKGLLKFWRWLKETLHGVNHRIATTVSNQIERWRARSQSESGANPWRYLNLRKLSPRQQVLFYYLAMVRRGRDSGIPRKPSQTPSEYSSLLTSVIQRKSSEVAPTPSLEMESTPAEIASLTDQFLQARYSQQQITQDQAGRVKRYWERIRLALRRLKRAR